jgi:hypothetical protein
MGFNSGTLVLEGKRILSMRYVIRDYSQISFGLTLHVDQDGSHGFCLDSSDGNPIDRKKVVGSA